MAQIIEEHIIIKVSKLVKEPTGEIVIADDVLKALESVAEELLGNSVIVEVDRVQ